MKKLIAAFVAVTMVLFFAAIPAMALGSRDTAAIMPSESAPGEDASSIDNGLNEENGSLDVTSLKEHSWVPDDSRAFAASEQGNVVFSLGGDFGEVQPGQEFSIDVTVEGEYQAHGLNMAVSFDTTLIELIELVKGDALNKISSNGNLAILEQSPAGDVRLGIIAPSDAFSENGTLFTLKLRVAEAAEPGTVLNIENLVSEFFYMPIGEDKTMIESTSNNASGVVSSGTTDVPDEPTDAPDEPTDVPVEPTDAPVDTSEPVATPQPVDATFSVGGTHYAKPGDTVTVNLTVNGEFAAHGANIWVNFDSEHLELVDCKNGAVIDKIADLGGSALVYPDEIPGSVRFAILCPTNAFTDNGILLTLTFKVSETAEEGLELPLEIVVKEFFNEPINGERTPIDCFAEAGAIVVTNEPPVTDEPVTPPPATGAMSLAGIGVAALLAGSGVVLFKKRED